MRPGFHAHFRTKALQLESRAANRLFYKPQPHLRTEKKRILILKEITTFTHVIIAFALYATGTVYAVWSVFLSRMTATERRSTYPPFLVIGAICFLMLGLGIAELKDASLNERLYLLTLVFNVVLFMALSIQTCLFSGTFRISMHEDSDCCTRCYCCPSVFHDKL